jgi:ABC-type spermidine/putrescine transport system permease subunit I
MMRRSSWDWNSIKVCSAAILAVAFWAFYIAYYVSISSDCDRRGGVVVRGVFLPVCVSAPGK